MMRSLLPGFVLGLVLSITGSDLTAQSLSAQSFPATDALQVFSPNGGEIWKEGEMREISWVSQQDAGAVRILLETTDERGNIELTELTTMNSSSNSISWAIPAPGDEALQARILIESGGVQDASNAPFTIVPRSTMSFGKSMSAKDRFELRGLYPNPAHHEVTFSWSPAGKNAVVAKLYNTSGAVVRTTSVGGHSSMLTIELKDLPQGAYFYELLTDGHISRGVLAIQR